MQSGFGLWLARRGPHAGVRVHWPISATPLGRPTWPGSRGAPSRSRPKFVGDTANTVARLSGVAAAGEVVLSQAVVDDIGLDPSTLRHEVLQLKGKAEPFNAGVWSVDDPDPLTLDVV